jgi:hypothetical protein
MGALAGISNRSFEHCLSIFNGRQINKANWTNSAGSASKSPETPNLTTKTTY